METLGAVSVVCSDKTGTLTQNKMTVEVCCINGKMYSCGHGDSNPAGYRGQSWRTDTESFHISGEGKELLQGLVLCNDAVVNVDNRLGDPTELALLDLASGYDIHKENLEKQMPRIAEISFDSDRKMMSTHHRRHGGTFVTYTKGAPERVLSKCTAIRQQGRVVPMTDAHRRKILAQVEKLSGEALRTLALAAKEEGGIGGSLVGAQRSGGSRKITEENLTFIGMVGMKDPPRPEAAQAVQIFREAGVSTVMITGDHVDTACAIGRQLGIVERSDQCMTGEELEHIDTHELSDRLEEVRVFARVSPAQKVQIVRGFREKGHIVAMTGDGVNDAPSLKTADIGIAMGVTGTDVAKQASDMILTDDNFATIEKAIEEGRSVYENIRKSVIFLLSSNLGEIMTMFIAVILGMASPLKSSHILWINLITDSLPALALGVDHNDTKSLMLSSPRKPGESLFARGGLACTCFYGVLITCASLTAFLMLPMGILQSRGMEVNLPALIRLLEQEAVLAKAQTYAFTVLGMSQLFHAVGMRDAQKSVLRMNHLENKLMILACILGFALQFAVTEVPFLIDAFGTSHLSGREWMNLTMLAASPMAAHEIAVIVGKLGKGRTGDRSMVN